MVSIFSTKTQANWRHKQGLNSSLEAIRHQRDTRKQRQTMPME